MGTAAQLCAALRDCSPKEKAEFVTQLSRKGYFAYLRRWRAVSSEQLERVQALELPGISSMPEPGRYYPNGPLAAHLLGFVGVDNEGLGGLEHAYDQQVGGQPGNSWSSGTASRRCRRASRWRPFPGRRSS